MLRLLGFWVLGSGRSGFGVEGLLSAWERLIRVPIKISLPTSSKGSTFIVCCEPW